MIGKIIPNSFLRLQGSCGNIFIVKFFGSHPHVQKKLLVEIQVINAISISIMPTHDGVKDSNFSILILFINRSDNLFSYFCRFSCRPESACSA